MGKEYIVKGAKAICKYGTSVGQLQVNDNTGVTMNGNRTATTNSLGNTFFPNFGNVQFTQQLSLYSCYSQMGEIL